jgi:hypothetical protein
MSVWPWQRISLRLPYSCLRQYRYQPASTSRFKHIPEVCVSAGGIRPLARVAVGPGFPVPFAEAVKQANRA